MLNSPSISGKENDVGHMTISATQTYKNSVREIQYDCLATRRISSFKARIFLGLLTYTKWFKSTLRKKSRELSVMTLMTIDDHHYARWGDPFWIKVFTISTHCAKVNCSMVRHRMKETKKFRLRQQSECLGVQKRHKRTRQSGKEKFAKRLKSGAHIEWPFIYSPGRKSYCKTR